jgi:hypothetical protein
MSILFVRVPSDHQYLDPGNWLFDEGLLTAVGDVAFSKEKGWQIGRLPNRPGKNHNSALRFATVAELRDYLTRYFDGPVREASPDEMPRPDDL